MLSFADVVDLLAHELTRLGARRLAFALVLRGSSEGFFLGHHAPPARLARACCRCSNRRAASRAAAILVTRPRMEPPADLPDALREQLTIAVAKWRPTTAEVQRFHERLQRILVDLKSDPSPLTLIERSGRAIAEAESPFEA